MRAYTLSDEPQLRHKTRSERSAAIWCAGALWKRSGRRWASLFLALSAAWLLIACGVCGAAAPVSVADAWYKSTRCNEMSMPDACRSYERCKATHRCARGDEDYDVREVRHDSFTRQFAGGNRSSIAPMNDFEDWKSGTLGWQMAATPLSRSVSSASLGWDTFDFPIIGSLELKDGDVVFDTDKALLWGDVTMQGRLTETTSGRTKVAVFNFMTVSLGSNVRVRFVGSNTVSIMSRSSMVIDTSLQVRPGTLGGFPGSGFLGTGQRKNNQNSPGSTSVRVYVKTLSTFGTHVPEIQEIETSAVPGQKIGGYFVVFYGDDGRPSQRIPHDSSAYSRQKFLETAFPDIGELVVERDDTKQQVPEISRLWRITFLTAVGNVPQLRVQSFLTGLDSQVLVRTVREGNALAGSFRLGFSGGLSDDIPCDVTAEQLRVRVLTSFPWLLDARVARTDAQSS